MATMTRSMNRVAKSIEKMKDQIAERIALGMTTVERVAQTHKSLDLSLDEFVKFQELKSIAMMADRLTQEEAQMIYGFLGETTEHFNRQEVHVKAVLTQIFQELLALSISGKL